MEECNFLELARKAKFASKKVANVSTEIKNKALLNIAESLRLNTDKIFEANKRDLGEAKILVQNNELSQATFNRLKLDENKMRDMIQGIIDISNLEDPIGKVLLKRELDKGLILSKISCPIGVLGIIFEARPDVISQISALAIKSSNAVILKGGKESINTNKAIMSVIQEALAETEGFPNDVLTQVFSRDDVKNMLSMDKYIDLIIPRGGNSLVKFIKENTKIPVLGHADGICHIFVDETADLEKAKKIIIDAKTQYPSACNSVETVLIHKDFKYPSELLKALEDADIEFAEKLAKNHNLELPQGYKEDYLKCSNFIETALKNAPRKPTEKQIEFAKKLSNEKNIPLPVNYQEDYKVCEAFISKILKGGKF